MSARVLTSEPSKPDLPSSIKNSCSPCHSQYKSLATHLCTRYPQAGCLASCTRSPHQVYSQMAWHSTCDQRSQSDRWGCWVCRSRCHGRMARTRMHPRLRKHSNKDVAVYDCIVHRAHNEHCSGGLCSTMVAPPLTQAVDTVLALT